MSGSGSSRKKSFRRAATLLTSWKKLAGSLKSTFEASVFCYQNWLVKTSCNDSRHTSVEHIPQFIDVRLGSRYDGRYPSNLCRRDQPPLCIDIQLVGLLIHLFRIAHLSLFQRRASEAGPEEQDGDEDLAGSGKQDRLQEANAAAIYRL